MYDNPKDFTNKQIDENIKNGIIIGGLTKNEHIRKSIVT